MELIKKYFPDLTSDQVHRFGRLTGLYIEWNDKVNLISRKDIDYLYERHVLHSLAIAKFISLTKGSRILDAGTGGGFPGIPLAMYFSDSEFCLVDSIGKKTAAVEAVRKKLGLTNVIVKQDRIENLKDKYDFVVSRAVAPLVTLHKWSRQLISDHDKHSLANGWIFLKGGDLQTEIKELKKNVTVVAISEFFEEDYFKEKYIVYLPFHP